jgi:hypothetical protein
LQAVFQAIGAPGNVAWMASAAGFRDGPGAGASFAQKLNCFHYNIPTIIKAREEHEPTPDLAAR